MAKQPPQHSIASYAAVGQGPGTSGLSIASFVLGLLGITCTLPIIGSLLGIVFGVLALGQIKSSGQPGKGFAWTGIATGVTGLLLMAACVTVLFVVPGGQVIAGEDLSADQLKRLRTAGYLDEDQIPVFWVGGGWLEFTGQQVVLTEDEIVAVGQWGEQRVMLEDADSISFQGAEMELWFDPSEIWVGNMDSYIYFQVPSKGDGDIVFNRTLDDLWRAAREAAGRPVNDDEEDEDDKDDSEQAEQTAGQQT